jgi:Ca-activated chloride channel family protein
VCGEYTIKMKEEKISGILFAENSYVLVPLTSDQNLIRKMLSRISTTLAGRYTAVGDALLMARNQSLNTQQDDSKNKRHQTFILFTDADVSRGKVSSSAAAKVIAEHNIPIYTIAIGSSDSEQGAEEIQGGLYQPVDLKLLENIAEQTKAKSYQVDSAQAMQQALEHILKQRQNIATPKPRYETRQLYFYPLILALLLLALLQFLRLIKNNEKWGGVLL